jgi:hypothetical protein
MKRTTFILPLVVLDVTLSRGTKVGNNAFNKNVRIQYRD